MTEIISPSDTVEESKVTTTNKLSVVSLPKKETKENEDQKELIEHFQDLLDAAKDGDVDQYICLYHVPDEGWAVAHSVLSNQDVVGALEMTKWMYLKNCSDG